MILPGVLIGMSFFNSMISPIPKSATAAKLVDAYLDEESGRYKSIDPTHPLYKTHVKNLVKVDSKNVVFPNQNGRNFR